MISKLLSPEEKFEDEADVSPKNVNDRQKLTHSFIRQKPDEITFSDLVSPASSRKLKKSSLSILTKSLTLKEIL